MESLIPLSDKAFKNIYDHVMILKNQLDAEFVQWFENEKNRRLEIEAQKKLDSTR